MSHILVCSPSGSSCKEALQKLQENIGPDEVHLADIETKLCNQFQAKEKLKQAGITSHSPSILDITWHLSRLTIAQLWESAAKQCLTEIVASPKKIKVLCCNLVYYGGRREEFYSIVNPQIFSTGNGQFKPSLVCVFIDDVYDMYIRLTGEEEIFSLKTSTNEYFRDLDAPDVVSIRKMDPQQASIYFLESQLAVMSRLLNWRNQEIIMAENLAFQFQARFMAWGVKQLTTVISSWFEQPDSKTVYLSHPISRPRDKKRSTGNWPDVVLEFNSLQKELFKRGILCVMPTAIDELRISRVGNKRQPLLEERWPLPSGNGNDAMYQLPQGTTDMHHAKLISYRYWDFDKQKALPVVKNDTDDQYNASLRVFEGEIAKQTSSRDHLLVSHNGGFLVFRPFIWSGIFSSGVEGEIRHWNYLAKTETNRRAVFIHFEEDVNVWYKTFHKDISSELSHWIEGLLEAKFSISRPKAIEVREWIIKNKGGILDKDPLPGHLMQKILKELPGIRKEAKINYLRSTLTGAIEVASSQVGLWICENLEELQAKYDEISEFLQTGKLAGESWPSKIDKLLPDSSD